VRCCRPLLVVVPGSPPRGCAGFLSRLGVAIFFSRIGPGSAEQGGCVSGDAVDMDGFLLGGGLVVGGGLSLVFSHR